MTLSKKLSLLPTLLLAGCSNFTDASTRLAYDLEEGAKGLGSDQGARTTVVHRTPSREGECTGSYKVQIDKAGAMIVWCYDASGSEVVSSHSTSYHNRFVTTPQTFILDKGAGEPLMIELERQGGQVLIADVR
jgi:hypothetical protein